MVASTVFALVAIGLTSSAQAGVAQVRQPPAPVTAPIATEIGTVVASVQEDASPVAAAPAESAPPENPVEPAPQPAPNPCADALTWVGGTGLTLTTDVEYHCPSTQFAHQGAACFGNRSFCPSGGFIAINMALLEGTSTDYLRHVVAHEVCHILDFQRTGTTTEAAADACAAAHGAPA